MGLLVNWSFAVAIGDPAQLLRDAPRPSSRKVELLLGDWVSHDFPVSTLVKVGEISTLFIIPFQPSSAIAKALAQQYAAYFQNRTPTGWSKALRPVVRLIIEGQAVKHREIVEFAFP